MLRGKRQRKWLFGAGIAVCSVIVVWFALPFWFPWVLPWMSRKTGVHYAHCERVGYGKLVLHGVLFTNRNVTVRADRVEAVAPNIWLWRRMTKSGERTEPFVLANDWEFQSHPSGKKSSSDATYEIFEKADKVVLELKSWIPNASL